MLCLKAEALGNDVFASPRKLLPICLGRTLQKYLWRSNRSPSSGDVSVLSSSLEEIKNVDGVSGRERSLKACLYRASLENDVQNLQKQLQEELDLHVALANAVVQSSAPLSQSLSKIPDKVQELLANIALLEVTVLRLEEELVALHYKLSQERNERLLAEYHLRHSLSPSPSPQTYPPTYGKEQLHLTVESGQSQMSAISGLSSTNPAKESLGVFGGDNQDMRTDSAFDWREPDEGFLKKGLWHSLIKLSEDMVGTDVALQQSEANKEFMRKDLWHNANKLSEEMVRCMRDIFLHLSNSSCLPSKFYSSEHSPSPVSPHGHLSCNSLASYSDSSINSFARSPSVKVQHNCGFLAAGNMFDPYRVHGRVNWTNIGRYSFAVEVSWMSVGQKQLEYAAEALKRFRVLVKQLAKVDLAHMCCDERLAFWINLYNALIMHAYLAYGVPKSDIKLFSLMQKAAYTVGGHSFSAADIEYIILKMKPPSHRPQMALIMALNTFKVSEDQRKHSIDNQEPLVAFALSCGMYSSAAVRIFTANNVIEELHDSLRDYIQASVGINEKGKLLVPKLLYSYAKGIVEDSLLADWICRFLSPEQVAMVQNCTSQRRQRLLGARSFVVTPFDSRFRYLFLPDQQSSVSAIHV